MLKVTATSLRQSEKPLQRPAPSSQFGGRGRLRTALSMAAALAAFLALAVALTSGLGVMDMARWVATQQRAFHNMISQLLALDGGGIGPLVALFSACLAYGFIHAAIPGHGKFLIAGAGLGSSVTTLRLVVISVLASLTQALTAIVLVYGSFALLDITAGFAMAATDRVLIPLSYVAIAVIALILIRRAVLGFRALFAGGDHAGHHHGGCNHRHGPTPEEADAARSLKDAAMLIVGIGLRPCTGAVFVLVAAWRMGLLWVGVVGAVLMALGTGAFISLVAVSAVGARGATLFAAGAGLARFLVPLLQGLAGVAILIVALAFLAASLLAG